MKRNSVFRCSTLLLAMAFAVIIAPLPAAIADSQTSRSSLWQRAESRWQSFRARGGKQSFGNLFDRVSVTPTSGRVRSRAGRTRSGEVFSAEEIRGRTNEALSIVETVYRRSAQDMSLSAAEAKALLRDAYSRISELDAADLQKSELGAEAVSLFSAAKRSLAEPLRRDIAFIFETSRTHGPRGPFDSASLPRGATAYAG